MSLCNIDDKEAVIKYINDFQRNTTQTNKNKFGEVFTPLVLINEILDNLQEKLTLPDLKICIEQAKSFTGNADDAV